MERLLVLNTADPEERRAALLEEGRLEEFRLERVLGTSLVGNLYKGRVVNLERGIGAAFVDVGCGRNGFLHVSDCVNARTDGKARIEEHVALGDDVIVQITRESVGAKGPVLTSNVSLPGRFVVLLPHAQAGGVSRRIADTEGREQLKAMARQLGESAGAGVIVRTAGEGRTQADLLADLRELRRLWDSILQRAEAAPAPALLHAESDLVVRALRDLVQGELDAVHVDHPEAFEVARKLIEALHPGLASRLHLHAGAQPIFHAFGVEEQIDRTRSRRVSLPGGGSLVFDSTEALVAVDVNSGKARDEENLEVTARRTNLEAAAEIPRQLRLRDLGGVIAVDFIDMREAEHIREVERAFRAALRRDRAHLRAGKIGAFGVLVLTRQRAGSGGWGAGRPCPTCGGAGQVLSPEATMLRVYRELQARAAGRGRGGIRARLNPEAARLLKERRGGALRALAEETGRALEVEADPSLPPEGWRVEAVRGA